MSHTCPVCGWPHLQESPRDECGGASFEICPSCGFEFGFDDDDRGDTYQAARTRWMAGGMAWWSHSRTAPPDWNAAQQVRAAGLC